MATWYTSNFWKVSMKRSYTLGLTLRFVHVLEHEHDNEHDNVQRQRSTTTFNDNVQRQLSTTTFNDNVQRQRQTSPTASAGYPLPGVRRAPPSFRPDGS